MAITQYYVNPAIAGNSGTGTIGDPFGDLQYALNTIVRDATDGDQINILAGTAEVLAASLTLATYGTPGFTSPLTLRGYTSAANDGGKGEIDCGGFTMWASTGYDWINLVDLHCHTFGDNNGVVLDDQCVVLACEIDKGASSPSGKQLLNIGNNSVAIGNYVHDPGVGIAYGIWLDAGIACAQGNYVRMNTGTSTFASGIICNGAAQHLISGNIVYCQATGQRGIYANAYSQVKNNVCYNSAAGTLMGIFTNGPTPAMSVFNNIVVGWSGAGGKGIDVPGNIGPFGYNAYYNNTTAYAVSDQIFIDLTGFDVALAADPFVDAANGNFALTDAAKLALRSAGWPAGNMLGSLTDPHITIGAVQYGAAEAGGGGGRRPRLWSLS